VSIAPGAKLGQYEVQDFIGQGAMGLVYRAYHPQLERTGAVKVLQAITPDPDTVARFRHEAQAIARLRHPNILDVYDFGEHQGTPYMIVEYVAGGSLAGRLQQGPIDQATAIKFLRGIASGLDYAHANGVVHRDVKPANVLLTTDDTPVLADFGLAKLMQGSSLKSMTGVTTGTPAYMAPEQVTGSQVGPPADRYALASIAYEMLTGVIPFDGEALLELLYAQVHREPPPPSSRNPSLSPACDAVIMRGLAKNPAARWESCTAFVDALAAGLAMRTGPVAAKTMVMAAAAVASTVPLAPSPLAAPTAPLPAPAAGAAVAQPPPAAPAKRRSRKGAIAILAAAIIVLLLIGAVLVSAAGRQTTLSLSSDSVVPGASLVVNATNVPANQTGEIQLWSVLHTFAFRSDANGKVAIDITVPRDIGAGDHLVKVCWAGTCHAQSTLHVIASVATATPTPSPSPTTSPSPAARSLALSSSHIRVKTGTLTVAGQHFTPRASVAVSFVQNQTAVVATTSAGPEGNFLATFTIPSWAVLGPAGIKACDSACANASVSVTSS
jgi:serine/threonine-protein kinase